MNILITGANGLIAQNLIKKINNTHNIYLLLNGEVYEFYNNKITVNLLNVNHVQSLLKEKLEFDILVHTASKMADKNNLEDIDLFFDNISMYKNLVLIVNRFKPKKVINFSSIAVYPNKDGIYCENSEILPSVNNDGLYGLSKFCGENLLDFCCKGTGVVNLRISQVYSKRSDRIFEVMKKELLESNKISVYGNCNRVSNFITIDTLVEKILFFINNDSYGVFNIGDENLSYKDLALSIINKYGNSESIIECVNKGVFSKVYINTDKLKNIMEKII